MFETSFPELMLVAVIGLLVLGPQRLPKIAAEIGKWIGRARRTATQLRRQLEREVELSELEKPLIPPPPPRPHSPPATAAPPAATPPPGAAPTPGEVPPGPGTHADQPELAEEGSAAPARPTGQPPS
jgi:Tat protein translocase TatB subunit